MAGGIVERPFALNVKCIVLSLLVGTGYWFLPSHNVWVLMFLFWVSYVGLSWYDELYTCSNAMKPTLFPFGRLVFLPFKPPGYQEDMKNISPRQVELMNRVDHLACFTSVMCLASMVFL